MALKTAGVFGKTTEVLMKDATGNHKETHLIEQRMGLAVQRGNALSILAAIRDRHVDGWS